MSEKEEFAAFFSRMGIDVIGVASEYSDYSSLDIDDAELSFRFDKDGRYIGYSYTYVYGDDYTASEFVERRVR